MNVLALVAVGEQGGVAQGDRERLAGDGGSRPARSATARRRETPTRGCSPGQIRARASTSSGRRAGRDHRELAAPADPRQGDRGGGLGLAERRPGTRPRRRAAGRVEGVWPRSTRLAPEPRRSGKWAS